MQLSSDQQFYITSQHQYNRFPIDEIKIRNEIQSRYQWNEDGIIPSTFKKQNKLYIEQDKNMKNKYVVNSSNKFQKLQKLHNLSQSMHFIKIYNREYMLALHKADSSNHFIAIYTFVKGTLKKIKTLESMLPYSHLKVLVVQNTIFMHANKIIYYWKFPNNQFGMVENIYSMSYVPSQKLLALIRTKSTGDEEYEICFIGLKQNHQGAWEQFQMSEAQNFSRIISFSNDIEQNENMLITAYYSYEEEFLDNEGYTSAGEIVEYVQKWNLDPENNKLTLKNQNCEIYGEYEESYCSYTMTYFRKKGFEYYEHQGRIKDVKYNLEKTGIYY